MSKAGKANIWLILGGVAIVLLVAGVIKIPAGTTATQSGVPTGQTSGSTANVVGCDSSGLNAFTEYVTLKNNENISYHQLAATVDFVNAAMQPQGGAITTTAGSAKSSATWSTAPPCATGSLAVISDTNTVGQIVPNIATAKSGQIDIVGQQASALQFSVYTTTLSDDNNSVGNAAQGQTAMNTSTKTLGTGGSASGYIDMQLATASSAFGTKNDGFIISARSMNLGAVSAAGISLGSVSGSLNVQRLSSCPADVATYDLGTVCWKVSQFNSATPTPYRLSYTVRADQGNPGSGDDVQFVFNDYAVFVDADGVAKTALYNSAGSDQGVAKGIVRVILA